MWWVGSRPHDVYIGTRAFAVCRGAERIVVQALSDVDAAFAGFASWLAEAEPKRRLRVWLSGGLCRPFLVQAVPGISGEDEWQRVATAMAPAQCGLPAPCRVWLSPASKGNGSRVAVALEELLLQRLLEVVRAAGRGHRVVSIRPWWSEVLRQSVQREPALPVLAVHDCDALTVLAGPGDRVDSATTLSPVVDVETAESALARMLMGLDAAPGESLRARLVLQASDAARADQPLGIFTEWSR